MVVYYLADLNVVFSTRAMRSNTQVVLVVGLSTCAEAAILVFSFYWAPWIAGTFTSSALASAAPVSVLVDTSAGTSTEPVSGSGVAAGADGLIVEVHTDPGQALSDGAQSLKPERFAALVREVRAVATSIGRT